MGTEGGALSYFLNCYLNQDWPEEFGSFSAAADSFAANESPSVIEGLIHDVDVLLSSEMSESALDQLISGYGSEYLPSGDGLGPSEFLAQLRSLVRARIAG